MNWRKIFQIICVFREHRPKTDFIEFWDEYSHWYGQTCGVCGTKIYYLDIEATGLRQRVPFDVVGYTKDG